MTHDVTVKIVKEREQDFVYGVLYEANPDNFRNKSMDEQGEITEQITQLAKKLESEIWR